MYKINKYKYPANFADVTTTAEITITTAEEYAGATRFAFFLWRLQTSHDTQRLSGTTNNVLIRNLALTSLI